MLVLKVRICLLIKKIFVLLLINYLFLKKLLNKPKKKTFTVKYNGTQHGIYIILFYFILIPWALFDLISKLTSLPLEII